MPASSDSREEAAHLRQEINQNNYLYHALDSPQISDAAFDQLFRRLLALESEYPDLVITDSPTQRVGATPLGSFNQVQHELPMLSLENAFSEADLVDFERRIKARLEVSPNIEFVCEPKIDGVAVSLFSCYSFGRVRHLLIRESLSPHLKLQLLLYLGGVCVCVISI